MLMSLSDEQLMQQFQNGDHEAFAELHRRWSPQALKFAMWWIHDEAAADDIAQAAFLSLVESAEHYDPNRPFRPWFLRALRLRCLQFVDRERRLERKRRRFARLMPSPDRNSTVNQLVLEERRFQVCSAVHNALRYIPERERSLIFQHFVDGITLQEIGEQEGVSKQRCHQLISRVIPKLKGHLAAFSMDRLAIPAPAMAVERGATC